MREIQLKKQASQINARTEKLLKFNEKMRKYELRLRKREINEVSACWGVMSVIFISSIHMHNLIHYRINLHSRSHRLLVRLTVIMRAFGKFLKIKSTMRTRISSAIINKFYGSIRLWVKKRRNHHLQVILEVIENSAASNFMFRLMAKWHSKIIYIQRKLRASLQYIKIRNSVLKMNWNRVEAHLYQNAIKKRKLMNIIEPSLLQGTFTIPNFVKEYYIRNKLKQRVRDHMREMYFYRQQCSAILSSANSKGDRYYYKAKIELPPKPVSRYYITKEEYKYMIQDALKNRLKWEHNPSAYMK